jgi:3-deoxy-7-phosphoheptulonate synthase
MHGNTKSAGSIKTRAMHDIVTEISSSIKIHTSMGSRLGGVHLELTADMSNGESVTECTGGSMELNVDELSKRFESYCDRESPPLSLHRSNSVLTILPPARLNFEQSLGPSLLSSLPLSNSTNPPTHPDVAFMLSSQYQKEHRGRDKNHILERLSDSRRSSVSRGSI